MSNQEFVKMVREHQGLINSICYCYFTSHEDQQDARQEIILQLWKSFPTFEKRSKLSTWVYKVGLNTILNMLRTHNRLTNHSLEFDQNSQLSKGNFNDDVEYLKHLISYLRDVDRAVVILYLEGYGNKEIATILEISETNVGSRLFRIKKYLRRLHTTKFYEAK